MPGGSEELSDPFCDPKNPKAIKFDEVTAAAFQIRGGVTYTPCVRSNLSDEVDMELYVKKEFLQKTGCFKERGARYALMKLSEEQKKKGVIAASAGNHAQGLSYHGLILGIPVTVVMPVMAPIMKIQRCKKFKARVVVQGNDMGEAKMIGLKIAKEEGLMYINGFDHPDTLCGNGTVGLEILEQVQSPDVIVCPIGGGGLISGVTTAVKGLHPSTKIIGVEAENTSSFKNALDHGGPIPTKMSSTLADGLAVPVVGYNAYVTTAPFIEKVVTVKEEWIALAILKLVEVEKSVIEGAGASTLAAVLSGQLDEYKGKKVVLVLSGGNIDTTTFGRCLERGLASEGRLLRFTIRISDRAGGLAELCNMVAGLGVSIKDITQERAWLKDTFSVDVKIVCETRDWPHSLELREALKDRYDCITFHDVPVAIKQADPNFDFAKSALLECTN